MIKKFFLLVVVILMGHMTIANAKINYVPLYIVDTQADVKVVKRVPAMPLFITQDDHKLILPEIDDSLTLSILKGDQFVYGRDIYRNQSTVTLPPSLVGDFEVRLCAATYYYYGYITLEKQEDPDGIPTETYNWENITLLGSNSSQQVILDNIMELNVVEYNMKMPDNLAYLKEEGNEDYINQWKESNAHRRIGLLPNELRTVFPQVVYDLQDGSTGICYDDLVPVLISCIQELKVQLDSRTEKIVDIMMSRSYDPTAFNAARAAIGNTLLSASPSSVGEPAKVRYLLTDEATNAYIAITDMGGRSMKKVAISPSDTDVAIESGTLGEGIFLCTLVVNGKNVDTKRLIKTK